MNCSASAIRLRTSAAALRGRSLRQGSTPVRIARLRAAAPAVCFLDDKAGTVVVSFSLTRKVPFGQQLVLVGDAPQLGAWDLGAAPLLSWSDGDVWHCSVELPAGAAVQYKFVQQIPHRPPVWESCMNRTQTISPELADLTCVWGAPLSTSWPALRGEAAAGARREAEGRREESGSDLTEDDAPAPAFQPAATLSQLAEAVKKSAAAAAERLQPAEKDPAREPSPAAAAPAVGTADAAPAAVASAPNAAASQLVPPAADAKAVVSGPAAALAAEPEPAWAAVASVQAVPTKPAAAEAVKGAAPVATKAANGAGKPANGSNTSLKSLGKAAGTVAMGVAATAMLSALAIDVTDAALLGAVAMGSFAAMSTPSPSGGKAGKSGGARAVQAAAGEGAAAGRAAEGEEAVEGVTTIGSKASAPGVILAASVLSALDAGKKLLEKEADAGPGEDEE